MGTYPWGPHGPQSGPNEVTPNPTPAYVPPPMPSWEAPAPSPSYGGQASYSGGGPATYSGPTKARRKSYFFAIVLALLFGPLGLFYASKKGGLIMLLFLIGVPVGLNALGQFSNGYVISPFSVLEHSSVMDPMLRITGFFCVIWSVIAVMGYNRAAKAKDKALAEQTGAAM